MMDAGLGLRRSSAIGRDARAVVSSPGATIRLADGRKRDMPGSARAIAGSRGGSAADKARIVAERSRGNRGNDARGRPRARLRAGGGAFVVTAGSHAPVRVRNPGLGRGAGATDAAGVSFRENRETAAEGRPRRHRGRLREDTPRSVAARVGLAGWRLADQRKYPASPKSQKKGPREKPAEFTINAHYVRVRILRQGNTSIWAGGSIRLFGTAASSERAWQTRPG
jgi:hypothetical protein